MPNTRHSLIKARFANVREGLDEIVDRLAPDLAQWAPAEGMRTVAGQLGEIVSVEMPLVTALKEDRAISEEETARFVDDWGNLASLRRGLVDVRKATLAYLDSLTDADLAEEVTCGGQWYGTFWLPMMPRAEHFINIAEHELYHVGQLTSYLWFRGDDPYKW